MIKRPLPRNMMALPCGCSPDARPGNHCTRKWIRCNERLWALRQWQWRREEELGIPHPLGVPDPFAAGAP